MLKGLSILRFLFISVVLWNLITPSWSLPFEISSGGNATSANTPELVRRANAPRHNFYTEWSHTFENFLVQVKNEALHHDTNSTLPFHKFPLGPLSSPLTLATFQRLFGKDHHASDAFKQRIFDGLTFDIYCDYNHRGNCCYGTRLHDALERWNSLGSTHYPRPQFRLQMIKAQDREFVELGYQFVEEALLALAKDYKFYHSSYGQFFTRVKNFFTSSFNTQCFQTLDSLDLGKLKTMKLLT